MITYEQQLDANLDWALREGSMHFEKESAVFRTMEKLAARLSELRIPYAVAGGMALYQHGFRRFTEDVDLLVTVEGLKMIHDSLEGLGYLPPFQGSKNLRDTATQVRIEFLVTGRFPGDGKAKPVAFPDPAKEGMDIDGIRYVSLPSLLELKLASGMSAPHRLKDLADVQEVIRVLRLPADFQEHLNPYVREKFDELWRAIQQIPPEE